MSVNPAPHARTEFSTPPPHGLLENEVDHGLLTTHAEFSSKQERSMSESETVYASRSVHAQHVVTKMRAAHTAFINWTRTRSN